MRSVWQWSVLVLFILAGCRSSAPNLKPEEQPESFTIPPESDRQYSAPYKYPKESDDPSLPGSRKGPGGGGGGPAGPGGPARGPRTGMGPGGY
jgi:hypothetical protein